MHQEIKSALRDLESQLNQVRTTFVEIKELAKQHPPKDDAELYYLHYEDRVRILGVMQRLYTENRLDGDQMRNLAQALGASLDNMFVWEPMTKATELREMGNPQLLQAAGTRLAMLLNSHICRDPAHADGKCSDREIAQELVTEIFRRIHPMPVKVANFIRPGPDGMVYIAFDVTLMKPGCALLQPMYGGTPMVAEIFNTKAWLLAPTPDLKRYACTMDQLQQLLEMVTKKHG